MEESFFRQEALSATLKHLYGAPFAISVFPYKTLTQGICGLIPLFLIFVLCTPYAEQYHVRGYLDSNQGIASIYPPESGVVNEYHVQNGQHVQQGKILLRVRTHQGHLSSPDRQHIMQQLQLRKKHLLQTLELKKIHLQKLKPLLMKKYISHTQYQAEADNLLGLEQSITQTTETLAQYIHAEFDTIRAPVSGLVTNIVPQTGQQVDPSKSILDIIPDQTILVAKLSIPVSKIGYAHIQDPITLHYDAYPDQHGHLSMGKIQSISKTITLAPPAHSMNSLAEPYYNALASLQQQTIFLHGVEHRLQLGMTCSIVIQGARKKIWQWMLDPLLHFHDANLRGSA